MGSDQTECHLTDGLHIACEHHQVVDRIERVAGACAASGNNKENVEQRVIHFSRDKSNNSYTKRAIGN